MNFSDQFAFRPTGSTTAAVINLLHIITNMLLSNPYVTVISLDFSKALEMVRHSALLDKLNQLDIPDTVYNWMVDVLISDRSHCTVYGGQTSSQKSITAGIIQGSGFGPAAYVLIVRSFPFAAVSGGKFWRAAKTGSRRCTPVTFGRQPAQVFSRPCRRTQSLLTQRRNF